MQLQLCAFLFSGIMPLWLYTYSSFLGLDYEHIAGPYYYLAGALGVVAGPLILGLIIQRCIVAFSCKNILS